MRISLTFALVAAAASACAPSAAAHDFKITSTHVLLKADGTYQVDMTCDLDALALGVSLQNNDAAELAARLRALPPGEFEKTLSDLRELFKRRVRIRFDDKDAVSTVEFPEYRGTASEHTEIPMALGVTARLSGVVPQDAQAFSFWASRTFQAVHLTIEREGAAGEPVRHILGVADESPPYPLREPAARPSQLRVAGEYLVLGFEHIVPKGLDHILFVLGLYLLAAMLKPLLWQVTAFTLAHSVTLGLSMYGVISLPSRVVEPLIALSIAYVAIENMCTGKMHAWRPIGVFLFGLLHGLGFAGVLSELGLPGGAYATALVSFNVGVELGQLAVILAAFVVTAWCRGRQWYRPRVVVPLSALIAAVGLYWSVERTFFA